MWASFDDGRSWLTADKAELKVFGDCARVTLRWNDGHWAYIIEDDESSEFTFTTDDDHIELLKEGE